MRHELNRVPQFYVTAPQKCPYIKGKIERKLFTALYGRNTVNLNDELSLQGFRRSQKVLYRPLCSNCSACLSIRIKVNEFYYSKSQKRVLNKNKKLIRVKKKPEATDEQFEIFKKYLNCRHLNGGMSDMDAHEFSSMIEETNVDSDIFEYWELKKDKKKTTCCSMLNR
jgi:arginyl-tRNA--protein-N-Asp/Glu arginylyltransferase